MSILKQMHSLNDSGSKKSSFFSLQLWLASSISWKASKHWASESVKPSGGETSHSVSSAAADAEALKDSMPSTKDKVKSTSILTSETCSECPMISKLSRTHFSDHSNACCSASKLVVTLLLMSQAQLCHRHQEMKSIRLMCSLRTEHKIFSSGHSSLKSTESWSSE